MPKSNSCFSSITRILAFVLLGSPLAAFGFTPECQPSPFGSADEIGRANLLSANKVMQAANLIRSGRVFQLGRILDRNTPSLGIVPRYFETTLPQTARIGPIAGNETEYSGRMGQWGSQFDGLAHFGLDLNPSDPDVLDACYYNHFSQGEVVGSTGVNLLGVEKVPPFVTRGILLDIAKSHGVDQLPIDFEISASDIEEALWEQASIKLKANKVDLEGDVVLIRAGVDQDFATNPSLQGTSPGIGLAAAQLLVDEGVVMVGSDTFAVEVNPNPDPTLVFPVHHLFLTMNGVYIMENLDLEALSEAGVHKFFFTLIPNRIRGAVDSPAFPIAID